MINCALCHKRTVLKFIMFEYNVTATEIAREINVSASLVRKHIEGNRYCKSVDDYLYKKCFCLSVEVNSNDLKN